MTSKEYAKRLIDELTEKQTEAAVDFLSSFFDRKTLDEIQKETDRTKTKDQ